MKKTVLILLSTIIVASCSTTKNNRTNDSQYSSIEELIYKTDLDDGTDGGETGKHKVPRVINESVAKWIDYFTKENRDWFQRALTRSEEYETDMKNILINSGVPEELFYLALIESAFVQKAKSRAKAQGIWQFMKGTGKLYGLSVKRGNDERNDPYKSCAAAAAYLKDLYNIYGSWYLAIASYNAGEGRIRNAILKHRERNFWELAAKNALPDETMNYVPKFIAAVIVAENYSKFGFAYNGPSKNANTVGDDVSKLVALDQYRRGAIKKHSVSIEAKEAGQEEAFVYTVKRGDNLSRIAQKNEVTVASIKKCNSKLKGSSVYIGQKLTIGCSGKQTIVAKTETQKVVASNVRTTTKNSNIYKVRYGDTLEAIAKKNGLTIASIKNCNPTVKRYQILAGQKLKLTCDEPQEESTDTVVKESVGTPVNTASTIATTNTPTTSTTAEKKPYKVHIVRSGESLWTISQKYNVTISDLMEWNNLKKRSIIFKGRRLRVYNQ